MDPWMEEPIPGPFLYYLLLLLNVTVISQLVLPGLVIKTPELDTFPGGNIWKWMLPNEEKSNMVWLRH